MPENTQQAGMVLTQRNAKKLAETILKLWNKDLPANTAAADAVLAAKYPKLYGKVRPLINWSDDFDKPGAIRRVPFAKGTQAYAIPKDPLDLRRAIKAETRFGFDPLMNMAEVRKSQPSVMGAVEALSGTGLDYWKMKRGGNLPTKGNKALLGDLGTQVSVPSTARRAVYDAARLLGADNPQTFPEMPSTTAVTAGKLRKAAESGQRGDFDAVESRRRQIEEMHKILGILAK